MNGIRCFGLWEKGRSRDCLEGDYTRRTRLMVLRNVHRRGPKDPDFLLVIAPKDRAEGNPAATNGAADAATDVDAAFAAVAHGMSWSKLHLCPECGGKHSLAFEGVGVPFIFGYLCPERRRIVLVRDGGAGWQMGGDGAVAVCPVMMPRTDRLLGD